MNHTEALISYPLLRCFVFFFFILFSSSSFSSLLSLLLLFVFDHCKLSDSNVGEGSLFVASPLSRCFVLVVVVCLLACLLA